MKNFSYFIETLGEFGISSQIKHPLVQAEGLPSARSNEIVIFETGEIGQILSLQKEFAEILVFSENPIRAGTKIARTNNTLSIPVDPTLLGNIIDPLGKVIFKNSKSQIIIKEYREIENRPLGINKRARIKDPLKTGITVVDMMIPLGKGQKELILGDRKTGKTAFAIDSVKNQIGEGSIAVYAAIARKKSDIIKLQEYAIKEGIKDNLIIVASSSNDSPSLIYLTPFTAMTIAEYFRDQGKDVIVVFDDLSTHAKFYREISLLSRRFPGRDSYPGDIFYTHARLLERAGCFKHKSGKNVTISCLPIAEIIEGDFTGYISTNLMGITDGHIFFDSNIFYRGRRPSVNIPLSVTRVGNQIQSKLKKSIHRELTAFLALYDKMQNLSHFGAELSESVKNILKTGEKVYEFFDQPQSILIHEEIQLILFALLWLKMIDEEKGDSLTEFRNNMIMAYNRQDVKTFFSQVLEADTFNQFLGNISKNSDKILLICKKKTG